MREDDVWAVTVDGSGDGNVVRARGELDLACKDALWGALQAARRDDRDLMLDLSGVSFLDSTALNVMLRVLAVQRTVGQELVLLSPSIAVRQVIAVAGLDAVLAVDDSQAGSAWAPNPSQASHESP